MYLSRANIFYIVPACIPHRVFCPSVLPCWQQTGMIYSLVCRETNNLVVTLPKELSPLYLSCHNFLCADATLRYSLSRSGLSVAAKGLYIIRGESALVLMPLMSSISVLYVLFAHFVFVICSRISPQFFKFIHF